MNLIKCERQHYYNSDKFDYCPHCANEDANIPVKDITGKKQSTIDTFIPEKSTQDKYRQDAQRKITGWLVCIEGNMKGDSFALYTGENHIGRDTSMDVILLQEPTVSCCNHALITYHIAEARFTLTANLENQSMVFHNKSILSKKQSVILSHHDQITLGNCTLIFVPLCGKHFQWNELEMN